MHPSRGRSAAPTPPPAQALQPGRLAVCCLLGLVTACAPRGEAPAPASPPSSSVRAVLDGVQLTLEVADDAQERAVGLMRRASVPPGTGMVFLYDGLSEGRYYMYDVDVPLRAVFVREGRVVSTVVMPPCEASDPAACPTYGADGPYDTVVETAPETLPDVSPGDAFRLRD